MYEYQQTVRDLSDVLQVVSAEEPALISLVQMGEPVAAHKYEWLDDRIGAEKSTVNGAHTNVVTTIAVADGTVFGEGFQIVAPELDETLMVTAVAGNDLTVTRGHAGSTAVALPDGTELRVVSRPRNKGTDPGDDGGRQPTPNYNHTEIFDATAKVAKSDEAVRQWGVGSALNYAVEHHSRVIARRMNTALIYGRRLARVADTTPGQMGGILQMLASGGAVSVDAAAAAISDTMLNNALEQVYARGGRPSVLTCNTNQARKISAFNANNVVVEREDQSTGRAVYRFVSDLPGGTIQRIVMDLNFPKTKIGLLDPGRITMKPLQGRGLQDEDARLPGADVWARRLLGEYTAEIRNVYDGHGMIENLQQ